MHDVRCGESADSLYDPDCRRCPRLRGFLDTVKQQHPGYVCLPVPSFGPRDARLLVVGLAPGLHGANASGRPFTGDGAGPLLYGTLTELGLARRSPPVAPTDHPSVLRADDGLELVDCRIANAVKCLPPDNKPLPLEVRACNDWLARELTTLPRLRAVVALGTVAHGAVLRALGLKASAHKFAHGARVELGRLTLFDSYHCSRYNQNTGRLTASMFRAVFEQAHATATA